MPVQVRNAAAARLLSGDLISNQGELHLTTVAVNAGPFSAAKNSVLLVTAGAGLIVNLPSAAANFGKVYAIKKMDAGIGSVDVTPAGGDTVNKGAVYKIGAQNQAIIIVSDGVSDWAVISAS